MTPEQRLEYFKIFNSQEELQIFVEKYANEFDQIEWKTISFLLIPHSSYDFFKKFKSYLDFNWLTTGIIFFDKQEVFWNDQNSIAYYQEFKQGYDVYTIETTILPYLLDDLKNIKRKYTNKEIMPPYSPMF